jgi:hypothetical protein
MKIENIFLNNKMPTKCKKCEKYASFGPKSGGKKIYCKKHAPIDYINAAPKCILCEDIKANFGFEEKIPLYCFSCKPEKAVDVVTKKCIICKDKRATFGKEGRKAEYCSTCKSAEMINVHSKKCIGCNKKRPSYGKEGGKPEFCSNCKSVDMVDVKHHKCTRCNEKIACFETDDESRYCFNCKPENAVTKIRQCIGCKKKQASFGQDKPEYCYDCKPENASNVTAKRCKDEDCDLICSNVEYCSQHDPEPRTRKGSKETIVFEYLFKVLPKYFADSMKRNEIIGKNFDFKRYRTDIKIPFVDRSIQIEIDEHQHGPENKYYDYRGNGQYTPSCEVKRMYEIAIEDGNNNVFIRFNTDVQRNKNGIPIPKISKDRLDLLSKVIIEYACKEALDPFIGIFMFYSEQRFKEISDEFVKSMIMNELDVKKYLHLVSYDSMLEFLL